MKNKKIVRQKNGLSFCCFVTLKKIEEMKEKNENRRREREEMKEKNVNRWREREEKKERERTPDVVSLQFK